MLKSHRIVILVAASENGVIGANGGMPWHLPDDLTRFKQITMGHPIVMGRRTWESIGRPLPGRTNFVLTRDSDYAANGAHVATNVESIARTVPEGDTIMVIGGGEVYRLLLPFADEVQLTRVHATLDGDTRFPPLDDGWALQSESRHTADDRHAYAMTFETWIRV